MLRDTFNRPVRDFRISVTDRCNFRCTYYMPLDECIDCGACEPECPWQAIFEEVAVPEVFSDDIALNYLMKDQAAEFKVPPYAKKPHPTADEVEANKRKWGWTG